MLAFLKKISQNHVPVIIYVKFFCYSFSFSENVMFRKYLYKITILFKYSWWFFAFLFKPEGKVSISLISRICLAKIFVICVSFCKWFSRKWVSANIRKWNFRFNPWSRWRPQPESWAANSFGWLGLIYVELLSQVLAWAVSLTYRFLFMCCISIRI